MANEMRTPLDDVEFLARSSHRVAVLETLTREGLTPNELREETDIPRATIGRVLGNFENRGWVKRSGRTYVLTPFGDLLVEEFAGLLDTVGTIQRMEEIARWLPINQVDIDLRAFRDATVVTPDRSDVLAHLRHAEALLRDASQVRVLTSSVFPDTLDAQREAVVVGEQTQEAILTSDALDAVLDDPDLTAWTREIIESGNATVYRYKGSIPFMLSVVDDTAVIGALDDGGVPRALIESRDETIRSWVSDTIDDYRERSEPVTAGDLPT